MGGKGSGTLDCKLVKLNGILEKEDGSIQKTNFFDFLDIPLDNYSNIEMTPEAAIAFRNTVIRMKVGIAAAIPKICTGPKKCSDGKKCPFNQNKTFPLGSSCPLEVNLINLWTRNYIEELAVDPSSQSTMALVNRLVELDLLDYRANVGLSGQIDDEAPTLLKTTVTETDVSTTETLNIHPLLDAKSRFNTERIKIMEALVASPREQYKKAQALGKSEDSNAASHMAAMAKLVKQMQSATKAIEGKGTYAKMLEEAEATEKLNNDNAFEIAEWDEVGGDD